MSDTVTLAGLLGLSNFKSPDANVPEELYLYGKPNVLGIALFSYFPVLVLNNNASPEFGDVEINSSICFSFN